jgi:exopolyphosphatase/guanosine-5'-triphosphate,3'-diphosphate pyrophosphatase
MQVVQSSRQKSAAAQPLWRRVGVIDVGSNSVRLVVHDVRGRAMQQRFNEKVLAGLGRGLGPSGRLSAEGAELAVAALKRFAAITRAQKVETLISFATAAVREASDGAAFCERVRKETGLVLRVLAGEEEARFAALGVLAGAPDTDGVIGDLGGSSLELARIGRGRYLGGATYPLGPLALENGGGFHEGRVLSRVEAVLSRAPELARGAETFFAVGGAWRSIASIHMEIFRAPLHIIQNYEMDASRLSSLLGELIAGRKHASLVEDVAKKRAATIPYAAAVLRTILEAGRFRSVVASSYGVREGVIFDSLSEAERLEDPLEAGLDALVAGDDQAAEFGGALVDWLADLHAYTLPRRLSAAACRLVDIGALLHPDHRAALAFDLVARAPLAGLTHTERAALALAVATRFKRGVRNDVSDRLLDAETIAKARALGSLMRLAADFSGRSAALLRNARLRCDGRTIELVVDSLHGSLVSESVHRRLAHAAQELRMTPAVRLS